MLCQNQGVIDDLNGPQVNSKSLVLIFTDLVDSEKEISVNSGEERQDRCSSQIEVFLCQSVSLRSQLTVTSKNDRRAAHVY